MFTTNHCRHCGQEHIKSKPIGIKNKISDKLRDKIITEILSYYKGSTLTAESLGLDFKVKPHLIRQILHKLNLKGEVSQKINHPPHDSTRDIFGGWDSAWCASYYIKL